MIATAFALSAADKAEADRLAKQQAAEEAARTAQAIRDSYEVAKAQANADASHRAFRGVIAAGHTATGSSTAEALSSVPQPIPADGIATIETHTGAAPLTMAADDSQALRATEETTPLAPAVGHHAVSAPALEHLTPSPITATPAASTQAAAAPSIVDRFGHVIACYSLNTPNRRT